MKKIEQREIKKIEPSYFQYMLNQIFPYQADDDEEEEEEDSNDKKPDFLKNSNEVEEEDEGENSPQKEKTANIENESSINREDQPVDSNATDESRKKRRKNK